MCVCVCVYVYIYIYIDIRLSLSLYIRGMKVVCRSVSRKASEREDECTRPRINHPDNSG